MKILPALLLVLFPGAALAQITLQQDASTPIPALLLGGSSFSLNLQLNNQTGTGVAGYDVDVEALEFNPTTLAYAPVSNAFSLTGVTLTNSVLNVANSTPAPSTGSPLVLAPQAGPSSQPYDLGASNLATGETVGSGVTDLESLTFQVAANASPGVYELEFYAINGNAIGPVTISDNDGDSLGTATVPFYSNSFSVVASPEPPAALLAAGGILLFSLLVRRVRQA